MGNEKGVVIINKAMLKMAIERAGMTQNQLAKELGWSKNTMSNKVNGHTNLNVRDVLKICEALNIKDNIEKAIIFLT